RARGVFRGVPGSPLSFFGWSAVAAAWLSLGPTMYANGRRIGPGLYDLLYRWVPGFNGLRVPSLNFMLVAFFLAVLAGLGAASLLSDRRTAARVLVVVGMLAILAEGWRAALVTTVPLRSPVYDAIRELPPGTVVA